MKANKRYNIKVDVATDGLPRVELHVSDMEGNDLFDTNMDSEQARSLANLLVNAAICAKEEMELREEWGLPGVITTPEGKKGIPDEELFCEVC